MVVALSEIEQVEREADCLYESAQVDAAFERMASLLNERLEQANPLVLALLTGGIVTAGVLLPRLRFPLQLDYIHVTRYRDQTAGGELEWRALPRLALADRCIVLVDDILDEGHTLSAVSDWCRTQGARAVWTVVLVDKPSERRKPGVTADIVGLTVPDRYVFGYGMDYRSYCRNSAGIYAVKGL